MSDEHSESWRDLIGTAAATLRYAITGRVPAKFAQPEDNPDNVESSKRSDGHSRPSWASSAAAAGPVAAMPETSHGHSRPSWELLKAAPYGSPATTRIMDSVNYEFWADLMSFRPPAKVLGRISPDMAAANFTFPPGSPRLRPADPTRNLQWVQRIQDAVGDHVNLDFYPVRLSVLPVVDGKQLQAPEFLEYIRKNLNAFVDVKLSTFTPSTDPWFVYGGRKNLEKWNSSTPVGSVVSIRMDDPKGEWGFRTGVGKGSVLVSDVATDHWVFSTIHSAEDGTHPVCGNRQFGFIALGDGSFVFYTRGADRVSDERLFGYGNYEGLAFDSTDNLWRSFQQGVVNFVNAHNGNANIVPPIIAHPKWGTVQHLFVPTEESPRPPNVANVRGFKPMTPVQWNWFNFPASRHLQQQLDRQLQDQQRRLQQQQQQQQFQNQQRRLQQQQQQQRFQDQQQQQQFQDQQRRLQQQQQQQQFQDQQRRLQQQQQQQQIQQQQWHLQQTQQLRFQQQQQQRDLLRSRPGGSFWTPSAQTRIGPLPGGFHSRPTTTPGYSSDLRVTGGDLNSIRSRPYTGPPRVIRPMIAKFPDSVKNWAGWPPKLPGVAGGMPYIPLRGGFR